MLFEVNGISLNVEVWGEGPAVLLLHGFTGRASSWETISQGWPDFRTMAVDIIGHGDSDSPFDPARYSMRACVHDLAGVLDQLGVQRAAVVGYSMGGRIALHFALDRPERVSALVLESASPGFDDPAERAARVSSDKELADRIERDGLEPFVDYWESLPMWDSQARMPAAKRAALRTQRLENSVRGLANSLRGMGAGAQEPVLERLHELKMPVLFLAGELDQRYVGLAHAMSARVQGAEKRVIEGAGHAAHLERQEAFADEAAAFLRRCFGLPVAGQPRLRPRVEA